MPQYGIQAMGMLSVHDHSTLTQGGAVPTGSLSGHNVGVHNALDIDADTLDTLDSPQFIRSDADDIVSAITRWRDNCNVEFGNSRDFRIFHDGADSILRSYLHGGKIKIQGENLAGTNRSLAIFAPEARKVTFDKEVHITNSPSLLQGGTLLYIEAGSSIYSNTIADDTTINVENVYINSVTGHLFRSTSGKKYKDKIKDLELDTSKIYLLQPRSFNSLCLGDDKDKRFHGLVADEVEKIYPEIIDYGKNNQVENYDHQMLMALMLKEIQNLNKRISALEN